MPRKLSVMKVLHRIIVPTWQPKSPSGEDSPSPGPPNYDFQKCTSTNHSFDSYSSDENGSADESWTSEFSDIRATRDISFHGQYSINRQKLQDKLIRQLVPEWAVPNDMPWIVFSCGAMGAGKSHVINWMSTQGYFPLRDVVHLDPDHLRTSLPEWRGYVRRNPETAGRMTHKESGYCIEIAQEIAMRERHNVWVDGSMRDADWYGKVLDNISENHPDYRIAIIFVYASKVAVLQRAEERERITGRHVPVSEIIDSMERTPKAVRALGPQCDMVAYVQNEVDTDPFVTRLTFPKQLLSLTQKRNGTIPWTELADYFTVDPPAPLSPRRGANAAFSSFSSFESLPSPRIVASPLRGEANSEDEEESQPPTSNTSQSPAARPLYHGRIASSSPRSAATPRSAVPPRVAATPRSAASPRSATITPQFSGRSAPMSLRRKSQTSLRWLDAAEGLEGKEAARRDPPPHLLKALSLGDTRVSKQPPELLRTALTVLQDA